MKPSLVLLMLVLMRTQAQNLTSLATNDAATPPSTYATGNDSNSDPEDQSTDSQAVPTRIVGGRPIQIGQAPWQAALIDRHRIACGASIINHLWVLTAAHCVESGRGRYLVRAGTRYFKRGGQTRHVRTVYLPTRYNRRTQDFDVALLRLRRGFSFGPSLRPVRLASANSRLPRALFVSGWGLLDENGRNPARGLRAVTVATVNHRTCQNRYSRVGGITRNQFCAAAPGRDSCAGDSGGPLVRNGRQYGIVSFGLGCARRRYPGVYTDIRRVLNWINYVRRRF